MNAWVSSIIFLFSPVLSAVQAAASVPDATAATSRPSATPAAAKSGILVFGDSLSAAYGIDPNLGWVSLLQKRLRAEGYGYTVTNASVSGETTSGGLKRLPRALELHKPAILILELGANDGLRGLPTAEMRANLEKMITLGQRSGAEVLLMGMRMPPNYGPRYTADFEQVFKDLAGRYQLAFVPFLFEKIALQNSFFQTDTVHPSAAAQPLLLETVWPKLALLLKKR